VHDDGYDLQTTYRNYKSFNDQKTKQIQDYLNLKIKYMASKSDETIMAIPLPAY
jgi:hypothetical protein